jgi:TetR/AcrR family transcriptional repressor of nem operon
VGKISKTEKTRRYIIETTAGIFNEKGYAGTSLSDLTTATRLTKGSIYGNFRNKDEVAMAAFDYNWDHVRAKVAKEIQGCKTYRDMLLAYTRVYDSNELPALLKGGCPLLNTSTEADDTHELLREKAADGFESWKMQIVRLINKGILAGEFIAGLHAEKIALSMIALVEGSILIRKTTRNREYADLILEQVADMIDLIEVKTNK